MQTQSRRPLEFDLFDTPPEHRFDRLVNLVRLALNVPVSLISLVGPDRQFFKAATGLPEPWASLRQTPLSHSFCKHVVYMEHTLVVEDAFIHPLVKDNPAVRDLNIGSYLGEPIRRETGQVVGAICAIEANRRRWRSKEKQMMRLFASMAEDELACIPHAAA